MEKGFISIDNNVLDTLLAISSEEQSKGLMFQEFPPPVMSFVYARPNINKFWMKNTPSPLDILFCFKGKVDQIHYGKPYSTSSIGFDKLSDIVIELPHGYVDNMNIKVGSSVELFSPTPKELKKIFAAKIGIY